MKENGLIVSEIKLTYRPKVKATLRPKIHTSQDAYEHIKNFFDPALLNIKEEAVVLYLNRANRILGGFKLSSGGISSTVVDVTLILSIALKCLASGIILAHNHPSGELNPSKADQELTAKLREACKLVGMRLLDHLLLTSDGFLSFADQGLV